MANHNVAENDNGERNDTIYHTEEHSEEHDDTAKWIVVPEEFESRQHDSHIGQTVAENHVIYQSRGSVSFDPNDDEGVDRNDEDNHPNHCGGWQDILGGVKLNLSLLLQDQQGDVVEL